jgi:hypothetical protein
MHVPFALTVFGLVPVPPLARKNRPPATTENLSQHPHGINDVAQGKRSISCDLGALRVLGRCLLSRPGIRKWRVPLLLALSVLGGIGVLAIARIDHSFESMLMQPQSAGSEEWITKEEAPGPVDPHTGNPIATSRNHASILRPVTRGMRPLSTSPAAKKDSHLAWPLFDATAVSTATSTPTARSRDVIIDVIVAFTKKAAGSYSDIRRDLVKRAIDEANKSFRLSDLGHIALRLVHVYRTDYAEDGEHFDHLWRFADKGDGHMEEIHNLRDLYRADVAILIVDDPTACGLATRVRADAHEAFAVVHHECAAASYTLAHEIGHLIGARHDLGYANGTKWRDIMSSLESCGGCPRIPLWSSPTIFVDGEPAGTAQRNNARVIAEQAARVAAFR